MTAFVREAFEYTSQVRLFTKKDWLAYVAWVGLMLGLLFSVTGFVMIGYFGGVVYPAYVWNIPIGTFIFVAAISVDTIGHRTRYKEELKKAEALVHHVTIFAGITSVLALCLAYNHAEFMKIPAAVLIFLSILYSVIDEAFHWHRYYSKNSDRFEMWSHVFILTGHLIMIAAWWHWFDQGYPGVAETLKLMSL